MKPSDQPQNVPATTEMLILPDGKILVHNLTPEVAALLVELNPQDALMRERAQPAGQSLSRSKNEHQTGN
jgi:hypothetical protein